MPYRSYFEALDSDPYFQDDYHSCYLSEGEEIFDFCFSKGKDAFRCKAIKRPVLYVGQVRVDEAVFDLETVYGYGGYATNSDSAEFVTKALGALAQRCRDENIIAHFMRFHPLNDFLPKYSNLLDLSVPNRRVVFIDLKDKTYEEVRSSYSSSLKRNINKSKRLGLQMRRLAKDKESLANFVEMYHSTMQRKDAAEMYFFCEAYFSSLFQLNQLRVYGSFYEDQLISMILVLTNGREAYYHLGATHSDFYSYNPNPFILDSIAQRILEEKGDFLFLGGGNEYSEEDPLFRFKKKFSDYIQKFYIGGSIFDTGKFNKLKNLAQQQNPDLPKLFLAYRFV